MDHPEYWAHLQFWAAGFSDGCTMVKDVYAEACWEHDYHYRHGVTFFLGEPISRWQADRRFREVIQAGSPWGPFSPMAWTRWAGVRLVGWRFWRDDPPKR